MPAKPPRPGLRTLRAIQPLVADWLGRPGEREAVDDLARRVDRGHGVRPVNAERSVADADAPGEPAVEPLRLVDRLPHVQPLARAPSRRRAEGEDGGHAAPAEGHAQTERLAAG